MANITINEISQNYTYNIGNNTFATVAMPITACWGPAFTEPEASGMSLEDMLETTTWQRFPASQAGLESFVSTYRGPSTNYRSAKDYSYQMAMTLLSAGYDVLVCRLCPGTNAQSEIKVDENNKIIFKAKYAGSFGNNLIVTLKKVGLGSKKYFNAIVSIRDTSGSVTSAENILFTFDIDKSDDSLLHVSEVESKFISLEVDGVLSDENVFNSLESDVTSVNLDGGKDINYQDNSLELLQDSLELASTRFKKALEIYKGAYSDIDTITYLEALDDYFKIDKPFKYDSANKYNLINPDNFELSSGTADSATFLVCKGKNNLSVLTSAFDIGSNQSSGKKFDASQHQAIRVDILGKGTVQLKLYNTSPTSNPDNAIYTSEELDVTETGISHFIDLKKLTDKNLEACLLRISAKGKDINFTVSELTFIKDVDTKSVSNVLYREWIFRYAFEILDLLRDKLSYNPNRVILPGWDDEDIGYLLGDNSKSSEIEVSPLHIKLMQVAYYSRCCTALLDIPIYLSRNGVKEYANKLSNVLPDSVSVEPNGSLFNTNSALIAPWGQYKYIGTGKQSIASPAFQKLMIDRAMILNQAMQYEWALPTNRKHNLNLGKLDYTVPKKYLDKWQSLEGVSINAITAIPDLGVSVWGNSTLYNAPPATYQALANLSTRYLVNAVEDVIYRAGISITFQYNNNQAYDKFYAAVTPILDTMKNVGAINDYYVRMSADINGLDSVNTNTVIGKVYLTINGAINDINVDLIALPPSFDLDQFRS